MDIFASLVVVLVGVAILGWIASPTTARGMDTFGAGFVPYRSAGWPHGVQEADPAPWSWSPAREPDAAVGESDRRAEIVEITGGEVPQATAVDPPTIEGVVRRRE